MTSKHTTAYLGGCGELEESTPILDHCLSVTTLSQTLPTWPNLSIQKTVPETCNGTIERSLQSSQSLRPVRITPLKSKREEEGSISIGFVPPNQVGYKSWARGKFPRVRAK